MRICKREHSWDRSKTKQCPQCKRITDARACRAYRARLRKPKPAPAPERYVPNPADPAVQYFRQEAAKRGVLLEDRALS